MWQFAKRIVVTEKLNRGNLQFAQFFKFARQFTSEPLRYTTPDVFVSSLFISDDSHVYKDRNDLLFDFAKVINQELRALVQAGCNIIQLDYPLFPAFYMGAQASPELWKSSADLFNREIEGVNAQIWGHFDWGRPMNQLSLGEVASFEELFKHIGDAKLDVIGMEAASTYGENLQKELKVWKEYCPDKDICIGVVNHRRTTVETPQEVNSIIAKALRYVPAEKLAVYNDCGLSALPRPIAYGKLKAISDGAKLARSNLSK